MNDVSPPPPCLLRHKCDNDSRQQVPFPPLYLCFEDPDSSQFQVGILGLVWFRRRRRRWCCCWRWCPFLFTFTKLRHITSFRNERKHGVGLNWGLFNKFINSKLFNGAEPTIYQFCITALRNFNFIRNVPDLKIWCSVEVASLGDRNFTGCGLDFAMYIWQFFKTK